MHTHTHTFSIETLDCFDPFKSSFPGSANHIALCARNPHRPSNHAVIWVEQAASVVVPKLLLWCGRETLTQRVSELERQKESECERESCTYLLHIIFAG